MGGLHLSITPPESPPLPLAGARESSSSKNSTQGAARRACAKTSRTFRSDSPTYMSNSYNTKSQRPKSSFLKGKKKRQKGRKKKEHGGEGGRPGFIYVWERKKKRRIYIYIYFFVAKGNNSLLVQTVTQKVARAWLEHVFVTPTPLPCIHLGGGVHGIPRAHKCFTVSSHPGRINASNRHISANGRRRRRCPMQNQSGRSSPCSLPHSPLHRGTHTQVVDGEREKAGLGGGGGAI